MMVFPDDLQNRQTLQRITRGVYLMRSEHEKTLWRFGLIGAGGRRNELPSDRNTANERLRQVSGTWRVGTAKTPAKFQFQMIAWTPHASKHQISALEKNMRRLIRDVFTLPVYDNSLSVKRYRDGLKNLANPKDTFVLNEKDSEYFIRTVKMELKRAMSYD